MRRHWRALTGSVLLLSAAGLYALMAFTVAQRRRALASLGPARRSLRIDPTEALRSE